MFSEPKFAVKINNEQEPCGYYRKTNERNAHVSCAGQEQFAHRDH